MRNKIILAVLLIIIGAYIYFTLFNKKGTETESTTPVAQTTIASLNTTPISSKNFDVTCYTEGLEFYNDNLYASGGQDGKSFVAIYDTKTGKKILEHKK